ncbi:unnamed protein product [Blepharisma stoltei]|uniref:RCC1-like domain-containing protein n=1 Tax=Blepharisma stoltei TaxID=1481888 RepID=A0AAU9JVQ5_9CILI|nr:unnamed protein product [Blepharisma stoltei]
MHSHQKKALLSCSGNHAAAIGIYGHLYVWGKNTTSVEEATLSLTRESAPAKVQERFTSQLGFSDREITYIESPIPLKLKHDVYHILADQVACGPNFTCIIGKEKVPFDIFKTEEEEEEGKDESQEETEDKTEDPFDYEIADDDYKPTKAALDNLRSPETSGSLEEIIMVGKHLRSEITGYLSEHKLEIMTLFKSSRLKEVSFINILKNQIKTVIHENKLTTYIKAKNMRVPGSKVYLKPIYELVRKCKESQGTLFIFGNDAAPMKGEQYQTQRIIEPTMTYHLVQLPIGVICTKVSCGENFVLVLSNVGDVYSWGKVKIPALGIKKPTNFTSITPMGEPLKDITDIACGKSHCLALRHGGIVYSWGDGEFGKLGQGNNDSFRKAEPINLDNDNGLFIRAGDRSSLCVVDSDVFYAWGDSSQGQFGKEGIFDKPDKIRTLFPIHDAAIGDKCIVFVSQYGELHVYGPRSIASEGETNISEKHRHLSEVRFEMITAKDDVFFALTTNGSIYSWSYKMDIDGKFIAPPNIGRPVSKKYPAEIPYEILSASQQFVSHEAKETKETEEVDVIQKSTRIVRTGCLEENTVLLSDAGEVFITGSGKYGQLGMTLESTLEEDEETKGYEETEPELKQFSLIPKLSNRLRSKIVSIVCGYHHVIAIKSDGVFLAWGLNAQGQLGLGNFAQKHKIPMPIEALKGKRGVSAAAGESHTLVIVEENGEKAVYAFGSAESGKLGLGNIKSTTLIATPREIPSLKNAKHVSCGEIHSLAIGYDGNIYTWGDGYKGQLGHGNRESYLEPKVFSGTMEWNAAECGAYHSAAIDRLGKVWHWGESNFTDEESGLIYAPIRLKGLEQVPFSALACGYGYTMAVTEARSTVYAWGKQVHMRLFTLKNDIPEGENTANPIPNTIPNREKVESISAGKFHGIIATNDGSVYVWGYAYNGRLGDPEATLTNKCKPYDGKPLDLSYILTKVDEDQDAMKTEDAKLTLQELLHNEPDELKETSIRECDKENIKKFTDCIDRFLELSQMDKVQESFFSRIKHKLLSRIQQEPFKCVFNDKGVEKNEELEEKNFYYCAMMTTYQMHACYSFKLLNRNIPDDRKLSFMNLIFTDMEEDRRLIYTAIYLCQMLLKKKLEEESINYPDFLNDPNLLYRKLFVKTICASSQDYDVIRSIAHSCISNMVNVINDDPHGIDPNPMVGLKTQAQNLITAYAMNRSNVDKRMSKLKSVIDAIAMNIKKHLQSNPVSSVVILLVKDLLMQCKARFKKPIHKLEPGKELTNRTVHAVLGMVFEPVEFAIKDPTSYLVPLEASMENQQKNLDSLGEAVKGFFAGVQLGEPEERWYREINELNINNELYLVNKREIVREIFTQKAVLEEEAVLALFEHSLNPTDKVITINVQNLVRLHNVTQSNLEALRVNSPSYDPLCILMSALKNVPSLKSFGKNETVNLRLMTRALRQDQSLVRCPNCSMLVPREMAPNNFKPVISLYDPMPPNSGQYMLTKIMGEGYKKNDKVKISEYLNEYRNLCEKYMKDFDTIEKITLLLIDVDTKIASKDEVAVISDEDEREDLCVKLREENLKGTEAQCKEEFKRRKEHYIQQKKLMSMLDRLENALNQYSATTLIPEGTRRKVLFNVEYGCSNRDLEKFSDSVIYSIYMNKIRDYTVKKTMSIELFENLKEDMKDNLRGFCKRTLAELKRKKIISDFIIPQKFKPKDIYLTFEIEEDIITFIATYSPSKINFLGRNDFGEEQILCNEKLTIHMLEQMREEVKQAKEEGQEKVRTIPEQNKASTVKFEFFTDKLIKLIGTIEDQVATYVQNVIINEGEVAAPETHHRG